MVWNTENISCFGNVYHIATKHIKISKEETNLINNSVSQGHFIFNHNEDYNDINCEKVCRVLDHKQDETHSWNCLSGLKFFS